MFKLIAGITAMAALTVVGSGTAASHASRSAVCVGGKGCFSTIQAAVDAAHDGDTITVGRGTFAGGLTIGKSINLVGSGAKATVISGGGPVVTIGQFLAATEPTVAISGVTITGGVTTSSPQSNAFVNADNVIALGGGVEVLPSADFGTGATVTISDSVVTQNRATPTTTLALGPPCPGGQCPFAWARGGGIDTWGPLTLKNTTVSDNVAAGVASDADGAGISVWSQGALVLTDSEVTGNSALATAPNGRFAEGGGIFTDPDVQLTISNSRVSGNSAALTSTLPFDAGGGNTIDMNANGGGFHAGDGSTISIDNTRFSGNTVSVDDANGEPYAFDAALHPGDGPLSLRNTVIEGNRVSANVASSADVGPSGSALDINGVSTVENTVITGNTSVVTSHAGDAAVTGAVYAGNSGPQPTVISNSVIRNNDISASSVGGRAMVQGAGVVNDGLLDLRNDVISGNTGTASGAAGFARGGGIWNGALFNSPPITLTLENTDVSRNTLSGSGGVVVQGGGLFTTFPVVLTNSTIARNAPDQCFGC
jgi:hypothetical protein